MLTLKAAEPSDMRQVQALAQRIWHRHYPGIIPAAQIDYMLERGYSDAALARYLGEPGAGLTLALVDDHPAGFAAWRRSDASGSISLDKLYVLQERHRHGIGRALIDHVVEAARRDGATLVVLNVNKRNRSAIDAYERCGFAIREAVVADIGNGFVMDDYVMARTL
ncbi:MAG TPA: GNAT family N-acetyltransferase [Casimicrobiaceae bacterium]|nr:GNAT family N-acetyltransferase [Casimicrobiaceae bacterium]